MAVTDAMKLSTGLFTSLNKLAEIYYNCYVSIR